MADTFDMNKAREVVSALALLGTLRANTPVQYTATADGELYARLQQKLIEHAREQAIALLGEEES